MILNMICDGHFSLLPVKTTIWLLKELQSPPKDVVIAVGLCTSLVTDLANTFNFWVDSGSVHDEAPSSEFAYPQIHPAASSTSYIINKDQQACYRIKHM